MNSFRDIILSYLEFSIYELKLKMIRDKDVPFMSHYYQGQLDFIDKIKCFLGGSTNEQKMLFIHSNG